MKRLLLSLLVIIVVGIASASTIDTVTVRIKAMRCPECGHKVMTALSKDPGFNRALFDYERRTVKIAYDSEKTTVDSLYSILEATGRYKASPYSPTEVIRRGFGQRIDDMHCQKCVDRIVSHLSKLEGIDSLAPHLDKHYVFIRYDANRTCRAEIRKLLNGLGYTPVNYYSGNKISWAYYNIPAGQATQATIDDVLILDGVEDVNVNTEKNTLAVTYFNDETSAEKLLAGIKAAGIDAVLPPAHECKEEP